MARIGKRWYFGGVANGQILRRLTTNHRFGTQIAHTNTANAYERRRLNWFAPVFQTETMRVCAAPTEMEWRMCVTLPAPTWQNVAAPHPHTFERAVIIQRVARERVRERQQRQMTVIFFANV
jgi:hypothetical protein